MRRAFAGLNAAGKDRERSVAYLRYFPGWS